ncbi:sulfatase-like hydrolase/transferase [Halobacteriovorax sp.]|uniref:sulfatase-like hydrolase/transferase n=1 Tax=Halobacteriovorax sp. TaxID=2020862 RepID=UPI00356682A8
MKKYLKICLLLTFLILSNTTLLSRIIEMVGSGRILNALIFCAIWIVCLIAFFIGSYSTKGVFRFLFASLVCFSTFAGMTYLDIGKHFLNFEDMELLWISKEHAAKVFSFYIDFMTWPFFLSLFGFFAILIGERKTLFGSCVRKYTNALCISPFILLALISYQKGGYGTKSMPMQYTTISTFLLFQSYNFFLPGMNSKRSAVKIPLIKKDKESIKHIIFIVDESIRADYLDFEENNSLTPYISSNLNRFINFGEASSANNCSGYSNAVLRLGGIKNNLATIGQNPTIWNYAKNAGFKTYYVDGQLKNGELQNFMSGSEFESITQMVQFNDTPEDLLDHKIAEKLREIVSSDTPSFVYVNKRGAHFPYVESYDKDQAIFLPQMDPLDKPGENREKFINSYKNSIVWNVDKFFEIFLENLDLSKTLVFYTSDHGQNLLDRGIQTHCNTVAPHPFEGFVPAAILTDSVELQKFYKEKSLVLKDKLTHFHFFPEIIKQMGYKRSEVFKVFGVDFEDGYIKQEFSAGALLPRFGRDVQWYPIR